MKSLIYRSLICWIFLLSSVGALEYRDYYHHGQLGRIDLHIESASLSQHANLYATVCIKNNTNHVTIPLNVRNDCFTCSTDVRPNTNFAVWNYTCTTSDRYRFSPDSRIIYEVWNYFGHQNVAFLGGSTLTVADFLKNNDNNRRISLPLANGRANGQINVINSWTA